MRQPFIVAGLLALASGTFAADKPVLTVLTYDSFVSDWGPGPQVKDAFEAVCDCHLKFESAGDGAALLARLRLEGQRTDIDIVLGLDTNLTAAASATGLFAEHALSDVRYDLPVEWADPNFVPFDWGYFAFVYDTKTVSNPPKSMFELAESDLKIVIQDPRSSTPGLGLLLWAQKAHEDSAAHVWQALSDNIVTVTKGWSEAYGMFLEGEADMVLSYTTSPAYHLIAESDGSKAAALFDEGHYMQIEVAGKVAGSKQTDLADQFLEFMVSETFQSIIPTTNWMYPAIVPAGGLPDGFEMLIEPKTALLYSAPEAEIARDGALATWLKVLSE
jgi:thiamine transport system substrate-binding protein